MKSWLGNKVRRASKSSDPDAATAETEIPSKASNWRTWGRRRSSDDKEGGLSVNPSSDPRVPTAGSSGQPPAPPKRWRRRHSSEERDKPEGTTTADLVQTGLVPQVISARRPSIDESSHPSTVRGADQPPASSQHRRRRSSSEERDKPEGTTTADPVQTGVVLVPRVISVRSIRRPTLDEPPHPSMVRGADQPQASQDHWRTRLSSAGLNVTGPAKDDGASVAGGASFHARQPPVGVNSVSPTRRATARAAYPVAGFSGRSQMTSSSATTDSGFGIERSSDRPIPEIDRSFVLSYFHLQALLEARQLNEISEEDRAFLELTEKNTALNAISEANTPTRLAWEAMDDVAEEPVEATTIESTVAIPEKQSDAIAGSLTDIPSASPVPDAIATPGKWSLVSLVPKPPKSPSKSPSAPAIDVKPQPKKRWKIFFRSGTKTGNEPESEIAKMFTERRRDYRFWSRKSRRVQPTNNDAAEKAPESSDTTHESSGPQ